MILKRIEVIDFESKDKIIFNFTKPRNKLPYRKISTNKVLNNKNIKIKSKDAKQQKLTSWLKENKS